VTAVPEAVLARVELPVSPAEPLPPEEMQQLLSWELAPLVAQAAQGPSLVQGLVGRGLLDPQELRRLQAELGADSAAGESLGQLLLQHLQATGRLSPAQAEELRQWCSRHPGPAAEEALVCRWCPAGETPAPGGSSPQELHPWLVAAAPLERVRQWQQAVSATGRQFLGLVPLAACGWAAAWSHGDKAAEALVEIALPGTTIRLHFTGGKLAQLVQEPTGPAAPAGNEAPAAAGTFSGEAGPQWRFFPLAVSPGQGSAAASVSPEEMLRGLAAWSAREFPPAQELTPLHEPVPWTPPWQRPAWVAAACVALWGLVLLGLELPLHSRLARTQQQVMALQQQVDRLEEAKERLEAQHLLLKRLEQKSAQLQEQLLTRQQTLAQVQNTFLAPRRRMPQLLDRLGRIAPPELVLESLHWDARGRLTLRGWAADPDSVQRFVSALLVHLAEYLPQVVDDRLEHRAGPAGSLSVHFTLVLQLAGKQQPATAEHPGRKTPVQESRRPPASREF